MQILLNTFLLQCVNAFTLESWTITSMLAKLGGQVQGHRKKEPRLCNKDWKRVTKLNWRGQLNLSLLLLSNKRNIRYQPSSILSDFKVM